MIILKHKRLLKGGFLILQLVSLKKAFHNDSSRLQSNPHFSCLGKDHISWNRCKNWWTCTAWSSWGLDVIHINKDEYIQEVLENIIGHMLKTWWCILKTKESDIIVHSKWSYWVQIMVFHSSPRWIQTRLYAYWVLWIV